MSILTLIVYTIRELASRITMYFLAGISTIIILALALGLSSQAVEAGVVGTLFGVPFTPPLQAEGLADVVRGFQAGLAGGLSMGVTVLGVVATAAIIPDLSEQGNIGLHLSKPVARWELLLGKYLGAIAAVLLNVLYFLGAVWLIFGIKVGVWNLQVLLSAFTLCYMFACLYSLVVLLGVTFRNTAISILGAFLYLFVVGALLHHRETGLYLASSSQVYRGLVDVFYYSLPELSGIQENITRQIMNASLDWRPFAQSLLSGCGLLAVSALVFRKQDF